MQQKIKQSFSRVWKNNKLFNLMWNVLLLVTFLYDFCMTYFYHFHLHDRIIAATTSVLICLGALGVTYTIEVCDGTRSSKKLTKREVILLGELALVIGAEFVVYIFFMHLPW